MLAAAFTIVKPIAAWQPELVTWWHRQVPFPYTGSSVLALLLGATAPHLLNFFWDKDQEARKVVQQWGDFLEMLLNQAMDEPKQVLITLKTGKLYVGFMTRGIDPAYERKYIMLIPMLSGYRDDRTKEVIINTDYYEVYDQLYKSDSMFFDRAADEFQLVVPVHEIASANLFDPAVYALFTAKSV